MGYGQVLNYVTDPIGSATAGSTSPDVPNPGNVRDDYLNLARGFAKGAPIAFGVQQSYLPRYTDLSLENLSRTISGANGGPGVLADVMGSAAALRQLNPGNGLQDTLRGKAATGLAEGSQWNPEDLARTTSAVRGSWANRGLGTSMPAQLDETLAVLGGGEGLRQSRQGFAQSVAAQDQSNASTLYNQAQGVVGAGQGISQGAGPTLMPSNQSYDMFNTAYNARAAANIATANNNAASQNSY